MNRKFHFRGGVPSYGTASSEGGGRRILRPLALREKISRVKLSRGENTSRRKYLAEKMSSDTSTQSIRDDDHLPSE